MAGKRQQGAQEEEGGLDGVPPGRSGPVQGGGEVASAGDDPQIVQLGHPRRGGALTEVGVGGRVVGEDGPQQAGRGRADPALDVAVEVGGLPSAVPGRRDRWSEVALEGGRRGGRGRRGQPVDDPVVGRSPNGPIASIAARTRSSAEAPDRRRRFFLLITSV